MRRTRCRTSPSRYRPATSPTCTCSGAMVNNIAASQTFIVTYTDNSTLTFTQNMSDWYNAKGWAGESVVNCSEDRNFYNGTTQADSACLYGYQIPLDSTKTVASVQLPGTRNIVMLAMDLTTPSIPGNVYLYPASRYDRAGGNGYVVTSSSRRPTQRITSPPRPA